MSVAEIDEGVFESTATIDNGSFGTRTIRFETGRLAQQAAGAVVAYLDDDQLRQKAGDQLRAEVLGHHDLGVAAERLYADLVTLTEGPPRPRPA